MRFSHLVHIGAHELHRLLECVSVAGAGVENEGTQGDIRQQVWIIVNFIDSVKHGFESLDTFLLLNGTTGILGVAADLLVHREYTPENYVTRKSYHFPIILEIMARGRITTNNKQTKSNPKQIGFIFGWSGTHFCAVLKHYIEFESSFDFW